MIGVSLSRPQEESRKSCQSQFSRVVDRLYPQTAGKYFTALRRTAEAAIRDLAQSCPSAQWLWYLRRLPDIFDDSLSTTGSYDQALMDLIAATSNKACLSYLSRMEHGSAG